MWIQVDNRRMFTLLLVMMIALCWLVLSIWSISPFAPYLGHEVMEDYPFAFSLEYLLVLLIFVTGWTLMTIAMMLPTSLPLIVMFQHLTQSRPDYKRLVALLIFGYLSVWIVFGAIAHIGDLMIHEIVHRITWLEANDWVISAGLFCVAGLYQFTPLKYTCLDKCRSPLSFLTEHWQGRSQRKQAFLLGIHHGLYCLGCCWSLMLLMFVVSAGNLAWMLLLGMVMASEKNLPWGRRLGKPLGIILLVFGLLIILSGIFITSS